MKCLGFLFHDLGKWADVRKGDVIGRTQPKAEGRIGFYIDQERRCAKCGKVQIHTTEVTI